MKNLFLLFVGILLFSCGKDDSEPQQKLDFPLKYVLGDFEPEATQVFKVVNGTEFEKLNGLPGSFTMAEMYMFDLLREEKLEIARFHTVELLDEETAKISITDDNGGFIDNRLSYKLEADKILISIGNDFFPFFEKDDDNQMLRYCIRTTWGVFTNSSGGWDAFPFSTENCDVRGDIEQLTDELDRNSNLSIVNSIDTVLFNISRYQYPLEQ